MNCSGSLPCNSLCTFARIHCFLQRATNSLRGTWKLPCSELSTTEKDSRLSFTSSPPLWFIAPQCVVNFTINRLAVTRTRMSEQKKILLVKDSRWKTRSYRQQKPFEKLIAFRAEKSLMRLRRILSEVYERYFDRAYLESENLVSCLRTSSWRKTFHVYFATKLNFLTFLSFQFFNGIHMFSLKCLRNN